MTATALPFVKWSGHANPLFQKRFGLFITGPIILANMLKNLVVPSTYYFKSLKLMLYIPTEENL